jgi:hypothetical protein
LENYASNEEEKFLAEKLQNAFNEQQNYVSIYYNYSKNFNFLDCFKIVFKIYAKGKIAEIHYANSSKSFQLEQNEIFKLDAEQLFENIGKLKTKKVNLNKRIKRKLKTIINN